MTTPRKRTRAAGDVTLAEVSQEERDRVLTMPLKEVRASAEGLVRLRWDEESVKKLTPENARQTTLLLARILKRIVDEGGLKQAEAIREMGAEMKGLRDRAKILEGERDRWRSIAKDAEDRATTEYERACKTDAALRAATDEKERLERVVDCLTHSYATVCYVGRFWFKPGGLTELFRPRKEES